MHPLPRGNHSFFSILPKNFCANIPTTVLHFFHLIYPRDPSLSAQVDPPYFLKAV